MGCLKVRNGLPSYPCLVNPPGLESKMTEWVGQLGLSKAASWNRSILDEWALIPVLTAPIPIQLPANPPGKAGMAQVLGPCVPTSETQRMCMAPV